MIVDAYDARLLLLLITERRYFRPWILPTLSILFTACSLYADYFSRAKMPLL